MSEYSGFYLYNPPLSCGACMDDVDFFGITPDCKKCRELNAHVVKLLSMRGGIFGTKAVICRLDSGRIEEVSINHLKYIGEQPT